MSAHTAEVSPSDSLRRVYMLVRKPLLQNTRIFKQAQSLAASGYAVIVVAPSVTDRPATEQTDGFAILRVGSGDRLGFSSRLGVAAFYVEAYRLLRHAVGARDIVHCNDLDTLWLGVLLRRMCGADVVYDVQDLYPDQDHIPRWLAPILRGIERRLVRRVQRIIVVNDAIGNVVSRRYGVQIDAVVLNCPPLDSGLEWSRGRSVRDKLRIPESLAILIYSGMLAPRRGLEHTILALRELDDLCLVLLGDGPLRSSLASLAITHGLDQRVLFTDFIHHSEVPEFIHSADIGIVPYEHYGLNHYLCSPNKLFHYLMAELPIVCSNFPYLRSIVVDNQIGAVFDPADPDSIARAVRRLREDRQATEACRLRLRTLKQRYCWEEEEKQLLRVYRSLL